MNVSRPIIILSQIVKQDKVVWFSKSEPGICDPKDFNYKVSGDYLKPKPKNGVYELESVLLNSPANGAERASMLAPLPEGLSPGEGTEGPLLSSGMKAQLMNAEREARQEELAREHVLAAESGGAVQAKI